MADTQRKPATIAELYCFYVITLCFAFFGYIVIMSYNTRFTLPTEAGMILTAVISLATGTGGYIIGSNAASKGKDDMIKQALETVPVATIQKSNNSTTLTLNWLGTLEVAPQNPAINDAYIDGKKGISFYWNGADWVITTQIPSI